MDEEWNAAMSELNETLRQIANELKTFNRREALNNEIIRYRNDK